MTGSPLRVKTLEGSSPIDLADDLLTVDSPTPFPPGTRLEIRFQTPSFPSPPPCVAKVTTVEQGNGSWRLTLRLLSTSRDQREALKSWLESARQGI